MGGECTRTEARSRRRAERCASIAPPRVAEWSQVSRRRQAPQHNRVRVPPQLIRPGRSSDARCGSVSGDAVDGPALCEPPIPPLDRDRNHRRHGGRYLVRLLLVATVRARPHDVRARHRPRPRARPSSARSRPARAVPSRASRSPSRPPTARRSTRSRPTRTAAGRSTSPGPASTWSSIDADDLPEGVTLSGEDSRTVTVDRGPRASRSTSGSRTAAAGPAGRRRAPSSCSSTACASAC